MGRRRIVLVALTFLLVGAAGGVAGSYLWRRAGYGEVLPPTYPVLPSKVLATLNPKALLERHKPKGTSMAETALEGEDGSNVYCYNKRASVSWVGETDPNKTLEDLKVEVGSAIGDNGGFLISYLDETGNFSRGYQAGNIRGMIRVFAFFHNGYFAVVITAEEIPDR